MPGTRRASSAVDVRAFEDVYPQGPDVPSRLPRRRAIDPRLERRLSAARQDGQWRWIGEVRSTT